MTVQMVQTGLAKSKKKLGLCYAQGGEWKRERLESCVNAEGCTEKEVGG